MQIFYTGVDNGDGSIGVEFYNSRECIEFLELNLPESYRGEGGGSFECDNFSLVVGNFDDAIEQVKGMLDD